MVSDCNVTHGSTLYASGKLNGAAAMTAEEITHAFNMMSAQLQQAQKALAAEQGTTGDFHQSTNRGGDSGIIGANRRGQMKEAWPKKSTYIQVSGNFKSWAKDMKDYLALHDESIKELIEYFDSNWTMGQKLSYEEIDKCCANREVDVDVDSALHMVIGAFLEGESKMLTDTAEVNNPENLEMHKCGLELWGAFNVMSIFGSIHDFQAAKKIQNVMSKPNALERRHQKCYRQAVASKEPEFVKMKTHWHQRVPRSIQES